MVGEEKIMAHRRDPPFKQYADFLGGIMVQSPFEVQSDAVGPSHILQWMQEEIRHRPRSVVSQGSSSDV